MVRLAKMCNLSFLFDFSKSQIFIILYFDFCIHRLDMLFKTIVLT